ncbi:ABC transporter ATP-binding protein [Desulfogranum japonicum]|uniref:ABC transporter ATP-binding protein n=1 Tax=Desulfogranum japonicum TaxID=231447 RepID=UPI0004194851|nr:ABC transporter ATP-binding protein [Desulfogranum japonicum]
MNNLVAIQSLKIEYPGGIVALEDMSFTLMHGQTLGIVGESGSGKTTLIRALINLPPSGAKITAGTYIFDGVETTNYTESAWRKLRGGRIAMIFQNPGASLNPMVSVERQFVEAIRNHRSMSRYEARELAAHELEKMDLQDPPAILAARPWQLSGGMKQRVAIAISLAMDPDLILADEPTSALDVTTQEIIMEEFNRRRREQGTAIIMVSHNICACARIADKIMVMQNGKAKDFDITQNILSRPPETYAGQLLAAIPHLRALHHE